MFMKAVDSEQTFCYTVLNKTNKRLRRRWGREGSNMNAYSTYETNYYISQNTGSHQNTGRKRKKYRITSKFRFITSMIIMIGLCVAGFTALTGLNTSVALTKQTYTEVQVSSGDTLWTIANTYKDESTDTRKAVYEICQINDIEASDLHPGMTLASRKTYRFHFVRNIIYLNSSNKKH